ncbi:MAG: hypothetical protein KDD98_04670 [Sphingomonadaceae bacterium]|nr:hypothetical protein [Sphingomonadaceae bacterium]
MAALFASVPALAAPDDTDLAALLARVERIEEENARLRADLEALRRKDEAREAAQQAAAPAVIAATPAAVATAPVAVTQQASMVSDDGRPLFGIDTNYSRDILDHTRNISTRQVIQLQARKEGRLNSVVTLSGEVIAIADAHWSNRPNKFGYLMRHPTGNNQRTKSTQEIAINSVQLGVTMAPTSNFTGYFEMLYDPEQSFGQGTITALGRNQIQIRKAYVMYGDLNKSPIYASAGKMDVPFGLQDSVSPFTNSSTWHAFAPLAYGGQVGFLQGGISVRAMAVVGGAQFRGANTPVDGTSVPSKLNNFAIDGSYTLDIADEASVMLGGSYLHGTAYCQSYPVVHFNPCADNVPAWAAYGRVNYGKLEVIGDFAKTTKVWPGTQVPDPTNPLSAFAAHKVTSFTAGGRYLFGKEDKGTRVSLEYSKFIAGPKDSPWRRQDQTVVGLAQYFGEGATLFGEFIRTRGFSPLNFISGGNLADGSTWSDASARSNVLVLGARLGF